MSKSAEEDLKRRWADLTSFGDETTRSKWWQLILDHYRPRPFHGLGHLEQMMRLFDEHKDLLKDRYAVAFAIFFKNLVFDPTKDVDAEQNISLLKQFASEATLNQEGYVVSLLEDSANNCTDAHLNRDQYGDTDVHYLIDFDTAWMADAPPNYERHCRAVRQESSHLADEEYKTQRLKILQFFLQIPNIFATKVFRDKCETKARQNIEAEIKRLSSA